MSGVSRCVGDLGSLDILDILDRVECDPYHYRLPNPRHSGLFALTGQNARLRGVTGLLGERL
jgi:hypothetical protein